LGFSMTDRIILAHIFFTLAWVSGCFCLWIFCKGVFPERRKLAWILSAILLVMVIAAIDFYAVHGNRAIMSP
jgi:hypothetical protein